MYVCTSCNLQRFYLDQRDNTHNMYTCTSCNRRIKYFKQNSEELTICIPVQVVTAKVYKLTIRILCIVFQFDYQITLSSALLPYE